MQKKILWIGLTFLLAGSLPMNAQDAKKDSTYKKWWIGSTLWLLGNFDKTNNPEYVQLNVGYRITPKDIISFRFKRSIYSWPIGIPFSSSSFDAPGENYPGHARILAPVSYTHLDVYKRQPLTLYLPTHPTTLVRTLTDTLKNGKPKKPI